MAINFNISAFKSHISRQGEFSRGLFFTCSITHPSITFNEDDTVVCKAVNLPTEIIDFAEIKYFTRAVRIPSSRQFAPITLSFYNTNNNALRGKFIEWLQSLNSRKENNRSVNSANYKNLFATINLKPYHNGQISYPLYTQQFHQAYPTSVSGLQFSYDDDSYQTYDVEFQYLYLDFPKRPAYESRSIQSQVKPLPPGSLPIGFTIGSLPEPPKV